VYGIPSEESLTRDMGHDSFMLNACFSRLLGPTLSGHDPIAAPVNPITFTSLSCAH